MDKNYILLMEEIRQKISILAKKEAFFRAENLILQDEIIALKDLFQKKDAQINELKEKNIQLQNALSLKTSGEPSAEFKLKLDRLTKEVDQCIHWLETQ